ncbi:hypothetical protein Gotur_008326, partial [Gossypium turneri]
MLQNLGGLKLSKNILVDEQSQLQLILQTQGGNGSRYWSGITKNMLGACTFDMHFVYVLLGWECFFADGRVLRDAISRRHGLKFPHSKGYQPKTPEDFFNMKFALARNFIQTYMSLDPIEMELGEGLPSNVIDDNELN